LFDVNRFSVNSACFRQDIPTINRVILRQYWNSQISLLTNMGKNSGRRNCYSNSLGKWLCSGCRNTGDSERVNPHTMGFVSTMMQLIARVCSLLVRRDNCKIRRQYACLDTGTKLETRCRGLRYILFL
jgi:hypothetical protein